MSDTYYLNKYTCYACNHEFDDIWDCEAEMDCPQCDAAACTPHTSTTIDESEVPEGVLSEIEEAKRPLAAIGQVTQTSGFDRLSHEAQLTIKGMIEYCLTNRDCMGMDEGFKDMSADNPDDWVEYDWVREIRDFIAQMPGTPFTVSNIADKASSQYD